MIMCGDGAFETPVRHVQLLVNDNRFLKWLMMMMMMMMMMIKVAYLPQAVVSVFLDTAL